MSFLDDIFAPKKAPPTTDQELAVNRGLLGTLAHASTGPVTPNPADQGSPFVPKRINLGDSDLYTAQGRTITAQGYALYYRRRGSSPQGLFELSIGGKVRFFSPGDFVRVEFRAFSLRALSPVPATTDGKAGSAFAELLILSTPSAHLEEEDFPAGQLFSPIDLIGRFWAAAGGTGTGSDIAVDTQPDSNTQFADVSGFSTVLVVIQDTSAGSKLTSFDLVPNLIPQVGMGETTPTSLIAECRQKTISIPAKSGGGGLFRSVFVDVSGLRGKLGIGWTNDAGTAGSIRIWMMGIA